MSFTYNPIDNYCFSCPKDVSVAVQNDLAITPSRMAEMVDSGIPVSTSNLNGTFFDGVNNPSWDMPIDLKRGVDVAAVWNAQKSARKNISNNVQVKD